MGRYLSVGYTVKLINDEGLQFDRDIFGTKKLAMEFAKGRTGHYKVCIQKNLNMLMEGFCDEEIIFDVNN